MRSRGDEDAAVRVGGPTTWRRVGRAVLRALREAGLLEDSTVVLIGSFARGTTTWRSDVDILVITPRAVRARPPAPSMVEIHFQTPERFTERIVSGDDFAQWAVLFGKVLYDGPGRWVRLRTQVQGAPFPSWSRKLPVVQRHLRRARALLDMGDVDAACEQALRAADHLARAFLLRNHTWPMSRPELPGQLDRAGHVRLARALEALDQITATVDDVRGALELVQAELESAGGGRLSRAPPQGR